MAMVHPSLVKFPDFQNKSTSHCNIAEASVSWCHLSVAQLSYTGGQW